VTPLTHDEVRLQVAAAPDLVYDLVADVARTPEWSPEVRHCEWLDGATGPAVGARFRATNRARRGPAWSNTVTVVAAERGREFAFSRDERTAGDLVWRYRFEPDSTGTTVVESHDVTRPVPRPTLWLMRLLYDSHDRKADLREGMRTTLAR
jgi:hypothetical protein